MWNNTIALRIKKRRKKQQKSQQQRRIYRRDSRTKRKLPFKMTDCLLICAWFSISINFVIVYHFHRYKHTHRHHTIEGVWQKTFHVEWKIKNFFWPQNKYEKKQTKTIFYIPVHLQCRPYQFAPFLLLNYVFERGIWNRKQNQKQNINTIYWIALSLVVDSALSFWLK